MPMSPTWMDQSFPMLSNIQFITAGGQKEVFSAEHPERGKIALKIYKGDNPYLEREFEAIRMLNSPSVPALYKLGSAVHQDLGQLHYVFEEFIDGVTLRNYCKSQAFGINNALSLLEAVLAVLVRCEELHLVHRDIKPDNIMINQAGDIYLLDFGIVRHLTLESITDSAALRGASTPGYAPLEQFNNDKRAIKIQADLFALAVTTYECLTGRNPFRENIASALDVMHNMETKELPNVKIAGDDGSLIEFLKVMASRYKEHRPSSAGEALEWVEEIKQKLGGI